ncbi:MAG TPA: tyrosine-protein phosphatase [Acidimicrobiales bacterium]|nr:tyrosine-protein phosphatase [Acidimicrobiales bacterium]
MTLPRLIALEGAVNFRDLGGYVTTDGQRTRWRVLFRADGLGELTEDDLDVVRQLGIRTVVDLRSGYEVSQSRFNTDAHPVTLHHFPFIDALPHPDQFEQTPGFLGTQYTEMLDGASPQIIGALEALTAPDAQPAVFHCTAGKDRTGLLAALVLSLLGVPEETVVADYALSGEAMARLRAKLILKYPDGKDVIADSDEIFSADPAHMVSLLVHLRQQYGSVINYASTMGVPDDVVSRLRGSMLEPAA